MGELVYVKPSRPKPKGLIARARAKKRRKDQQYAKGIREQVFWRDEICRLVGVDDCAGPEEWAHLQDQQRFRTRCMAPELRHSTGGSFKACRSHHRRYDAGEIDIEAVDPALGADWHLKVTVDGVYTYV